MLNRLILSFLCDIARQCTAHRQQRVNDAVAASHGDVMERKIDITAAAADAEEEEEESSSSKRFVLYKIDVCL